MPGTYSIISRASGSLLTAAVYMEDHQAHLTFNTPGGCDDYSTNVSQMQSAVDPGEVGTESLPADLAGELQRFRFSLTELKQAFNPALLYWYQSPGSALVVPADPTTALGIATKQSLDRQTKKVIYGLTYDNGTDATNDFNINTGGAMDATGAYWMTLATALGKQSDVLWAVGGTPGTPLGMLDAGTVGNSGYYLWLIARSDTGVVDVLCSLSSTAPDMTRPGGSYNFKRLIGWFTRVGGTVVACHTYEENGGGLKLLWDSPTLDIDLVDTLTTARRTDAVKVPLNISVDALLNVRVADVTTAFVTWVYCPDHADLAPSTTAAPLHSFNSSTAFAGSGQLSVRTSAAGLIAARANLATVDSYRVSTLGFTWARRN